MHAAMQTSAPDDIELAKTARALSLGPVRTDCSLDLTGILLHAEVAMRPTGGGRFLPAIQLELDDVGAGHHHLVAYVLYPLGDRENAEAKAKALRRGERLTVRTNLTDLRLLLPAATFPHDTP